MKKQAYLTRARISFLPIVILSIVVLSRLYGGVLFGSSLKPAHPHESLASKCNPLSNEMNDTASDTPLFSMPLPAYSQKLSQLPHLSSNLISNSDMLTYNKDTDSPFTFSRSQENTDTSRAIFISTSDDRYLQTFQSGDSQETASPPSWVHEPVAVTGGKTYLYEFEYRTDIPIKVSSELHSGTGVTSKAEVQLDPSTTWKKHSGYYRVAPNQMSPKLSFIATSLKIGTLDTKSYSIVETVDSTLKQGLVSITFDDGWKSVYSSALPILNSFDYKSTQYVISEYATKANNNDGYMNKQEVYDLAKQGHEIASHSNFHCDYSTFSLNTVEEDARISRIKIEKVVNPVISFAYPYGKYTTTSQQVLSREYKLIRTSDTGYNDLLFDRTNIRSFSIESDTSTDEFAQIINYAKLHNVWVVLVYHQVGEDGSYSVTEADFKAQMTKIQESALQVKTVAGAAQLIESTYSTTTK